MTNDAMTPPATDAAEKRRQLTKAAVRLTFTVLFLGALLFGTAGTLNWPMAWAYLGTYVVSLIVSMRVIFRKQPDLVDERADRHADAKEWDKVLSTVLIVLTLFGPMPIAGLDVRFGWSPGLPLALQIVALAVYLMGSALGSWAAASNRFYSRVVRIQTDRGHTVSSGGPYRYVRHPGYVGSIVNMLMLPVILGSLWAFIPVAISLAGLIVRTALEDRTLHEELDGYREYAQQTRYRLLPGVW